MASHHIRRRLADRLASIKGSALGKPSQTPCCGLRLRISWRRSTFVQSWMPQAPRLSLRQRSSLDLQGEFRHNPSP